DISSTNADLGADVRMFLTAEAASSQGTDMAIVSQIPEGVTQRVVLEDNRAYPFTLTANFRDTCLYRYRSDSNTPIENLFVSGNELVMQAQNGIRVWISNENAVTTKIIADGRTYDLGTGSPGKVAVKDIRWIRESDGIYKLVVIDID
ncbi:MAG: helix-turn-helix domain-containing protein, partial [Spirochaetales bacterium]